MIVKFLCNCTVEVEPESKLSPANFDLEGFLVCKLHKYRRYAWRSVPYGRGARSASWSELEYESYLLWGVLPQRPRAMLVSTVSDKKDNRDPSVIGEEYFRQRGSL